jgi:hypothetical protein
MSNPADASSTASPPGSPAGRSGGGSSELITSQGRTQIADTVVSKIAGVATREVTGVHQLDGGTARAFGAIRERIPGVSTKVTPATRSRSSPASSDGPTPAGRAGACRARPRRGSHHLRGAGLPSGGGPARPGRSARSRPTAPGIASPASEPPTSRTAASTCRHTDARPAARISPTGRSSIVSTIISVGLCAYCLGTDCAIRVSQAMQSSPVLRPPTKAPNL